MRFVSKNINVFISDLFGLINIFFSLLQSLSLIIVYISIIRIISFQYSYLFYFELNGSVADKHSNFNV